MGTVSSASATPDPEPQATASATMAIQSSIVPSAPNARLPSKPVARQTHNARAGPGPSTLARAPAARLPHVVTSQDKEDGEISDGDEQDAPLPSPRPRAAYEPLNTKDVRRQPARSPVSYNHVRPTRQSLKPSEETGPSPKRYVPVAPAGTAHGKLRGGTAAKREYDPGIEVEVKTRISAGSRESPGPLPPAPASKLQTPHAPISQLIT
jgi:hypothetical protein